MRGMDAGSHRFVYRQLYLYTEFGRCLQVHVRLLLYCASVFGVSPSITIQFALLVAVVWRTITSYLRLSVILRMFDAWGVYLSVMLSMTVYLKLTPNIL